jgi:hypothetical protein
MLNLRSVKMLKSEEKSENYTRETAVRRQKRHSNSDGLRLTVTHW